MSDEQGKTENTEAKTETKPEVNAEGVKSSFIESLRKSYESGGKDKEPEKNKEPEKKEQEIKPEKEENGKDYNFAQVREKLEKTEKAYEEARAKLEKLEAEMPKDYEQTKKEKDELASIVERLSLERSPRFKKKYEEPISEALSAIKKSLSSEDQETVEALVSWVQSPDSAERTSKLNEAIESLSGLTKTRVESAIIKYEQVNKDRENELSNAKKSLQDEQMYLTEEQKKKSQFAMSVLDSVKLEAEKSNPLLKKMEGKEEWNKNIDNIHNTVKDYFTGSRDLKDIAALTYKGVMYDTLDKLSEELYKKLEAANKELEEIKNASAKVGSGASKKDGVSTQTFSGRMGEFAKKS